MLLPHRQQHNRRWRAGRELYSIAVSKCQLTVPSLRGFHAESHARNAAAHSPCRCSVAYTLPCHSSLSDLHHMASLVLSLAVSLPSSLVSLSVPLSPCLPYFHACVQVQDLPPEWVKESTPARGDARTCEKANTGKQIMHKTIHRLRPKQQIGPRHSWRVGASFFVR